MTTVLVLAAHPDDAEVCLGGSLARFGASKCEVHICVSSLPDQAERRRTEAAEGARILGAQLHWVKCRKNTWQVEDIPTYQLVAFFDSLITEVQPEILFTHWPGDTHYDHVCVARAALAASRRRRLEVLFCEPPNLLAPTSAAFQPNTFIEVTEHLERGIEAVRAHRSQEQSRGFEEQMRVRARFHGHRLGVKYAEAFLCAWRMLEI
jgi:LmbE family N-acetylglucosaminyl deacetylase